MSVRPRRIIIVSAFLFAATGIAALTGLSLLFPGPALDHLWTLNPAAFARFHALGRAAGLFLLVVGATTLFAAVGLLKGRRWAWRLAVGIFAANGLGDLARLGMGDVLEGLAGLLVASGFLWLLLSARGQQPDNE